MRYLLLPILLCCLFIACDKENNEPDAQGNPFIITPSAKPLIIAHAGAKGLKPENTMMAFNNAFAVGIDVLEFDIALTKDSVLVIIHDLTVDRTSDGTGNVIDFTYDELQLLNFGHEFQDDMGNYPYRADPVRIPTLNETLIAFPDKLLNIEIKDEAEAGKLAAKMLVEAIDQYHTPEKIVAFSFNFDVMDYFRVINTNGIYTGASLAEGLDLYNAVLNNTIDSVEIKPEIFSIPQTFGGFVFTTDSLVRILHEKGAGVHYWTINDKAEMKALIELGADGLITDYPDRMQEVLDEMGF